MATQHAALIACKLVVCSRLTVVSVVFDDPAFKKGSFLDLVGRLKGGEIFL